MKLCAICGRKCGDTVATCPTCGEASWTALGESEAKAAATVQSEPEAKPEPVVEPQRYESNRDRRGGKRRW